MNYVGLKCPVCGKVFTENDDIVVCPVCGAPYHRECYAKVGDCVFADKHGTPQAWSPPAQEANPKDNPSGDSQSKTKRCPRCGAMNSDSAVFCEHCGLPLSANQPQAANTPSGAVRNNGASYGPIPPYGPVPPYGQVPQNGQVPFIFDPMGGVKPDELIDGVPAVDMAKFVQSNTQYYLPVFMNLKKFARNRFNFTAFLFPCIWALYRKMYKIGSILTSAMVAIYVFLIYIMVNNILPICKQIVMQVGGDPETLVMNAAQKQEFINQFYTLPSGTKFLIFIPTIIIIIQLAIKLIVGFSANKMYLRHSVNILHQIHQTAAQPSQADQQIYKNGGVNVFVSICFIIGCFILYYAALLI